MIDYIDKRIIAASMSDARMQGGALQFDRTTLDYGGGLKLYLANALETTDEGDRGHVLEISIVQPPDGIHCLSVRVGDWVIHDGKMIVVS